MAGLFSSSSFLLSLSLGSTLYLALKLAAPASCYGGWVDPSKGSQLASPVTHQEALLGPSSFFPGSAVKTPLQGFLKGEQGVPKLPLSSVVLMLSCELTD